MTTPLPSHRVCNGALAGAAVGSSCSCLTVLGLVVAVGSFGAGDCWSRGEGMSAAGVPHCSGDAGGVARPPPALAFTGVLTDASAHQQMKELRWFPARL